MALAIAARLTPEVDVRFATLCHDLGKGLTPKEFWPHHHGHGPAGVRLVEAPVPAAAGAQPGARSEQAGGRVP